MEQGGLDVKIFTSSQNHISLKLSLNRHINKASFHNEDSRKNIHTEDNSSKQIIEYLKIGKSSNENISFEFKQEIKVNSNASYNNYAGIKLGERIYLAAKDYGVALDEIMRDYTGDECEERIEALNQAHSSSAEAVVSEYAQYFFDYLVRSGSGFFTNEGKEQIIADMSKSKAQFIEDITAMFENARNYMRQNRDIETANHDIITGSAKTFTFTDLLAMDDGFMSEFNSILSKSEDISDNAFNKLVYEYGLSDYAGDFFFNVLEYKGKIVRQILPSNYYHHMFTGVSIYDPINDPQPSSFMLEPLKKTTYYAEKYGKVNIAKSMAALADNYKKALDEINNRPRYERDEHIKALDEAYESAVNVMSTEFISEFLYFAKDYRNEYISIERSKVIYTRNNAEIQQKNFAKDKKMFSNGIKDIPKHEFEKKTFADMNYINKEMEQQFFNDLKGIFYNARDYVLKNGDMETALHDDITGKSRTFTYTDLLALDDGLKEEIIYFTLNRNSWEVENKMQNNISKSRLSDFAKQFFSEMIKETSECYEEEEKLIKDCHEYYEQFGIYIMNSHMISKVTLRNYQIQLEYERNNPSAPRVLPLHVNGNLLLGKAIDIYT